MYWKKDTPLQAIEEMLLLKRERSKEKRKEKQKHILKNLRVNGWSNLQDRWHICPAVQMAVSGNPNIYLMPFHKRQIQKVFFF